MPNSCTVVNAVDWTVGMEEYPCNSHPVFASVIFMNAQIQNRSEIAERSSGADTVVGFAVLGMLAAGTVGVLKAMNMEHGVDVFFCLLGSLTAFGCVWYIYGGKP